MLKPLRVLLVLFTVVVLVIGTGCRRAPIRPPAVPPTSPENSGPAAGAPPAEAQAEKPAAGEAVPPAAPQQAKDPAPTATAKAENAAAGSKAQDRNTSPKANAATPVAVHKPAGDVLVLWITRDFGADTLKAANIKPAEGEQVLEVLAQQAQVETAYGGGFVTRINGLGGGKPGEDWFYWVNGILAGIGAGEFPARPGDTVWWDFHPWNRTAFLPAVVGAYPEPFIHGYTGQAAAAQVVYSAGAKEAGEAVARSLQAAGAPEPQLVAYKEGLLLKRSAPTLLVANWLEVSADKELAGLLQNWRKTGLYLRFSDKGLTTLGADGAEVKSFAAGAGAIVATGSGAGDKNPLWLILGTEAEGLERAVQLLGERPEQLGKRVGVVVGPAGEVVPLPAVKNQ